MYIYRELKDYFTRYFTGLEPRGLIISGVVGCGKTTLVESFLSGLDATWDVFRFSGDETRFRRSVVDDSNYILEFVRSRTSRSQVLVFVDEVQKSEAAFDALKIAIDRGKINFIVSGSNPAYLGSVARKRLQRRADQWGMLPISLSELAVDKKLAGPADAGLIRKLLFDLKSPNDFELPQVGLSAELEALKKDYFVFGGLPLALLAQEPLRKLQEIKLTVERGFELFSTSNNALADTVRVELAHLQSREFTYQNIFDKTRTRKRDAVNKVIDELIQHGYMVRKKPYLLFAKKSSYLTIFSYTDPGVVSYLTATTDYESNLGSQIEGYIHGRLNYLLGNFPIKSELFYFKEQTLDTNKNIRFLPGEIDFVIKLGRRIIPIEVKATSDLSSIDTRVIKTFIQKNSLAFGIVVYGGVPRVEGKLVYWPYWLF